MPRKGLKDSSEILTKLSNLSLGKVTIKTIGDFKIKLNYDSIKQEDFLRTVIDAYINDDPHIRAIVEKIQTTNKNFKAIRQSETKKAYQQKDEFALNDVELDDIFDIIEQDHPDLN